LIYINIESQLQFFGIVGNSNVDSWYGDSWKDISSKIESSPITSNSFSEVINALYLFHRYIKNK